MVSSDRCGLAHVPVILRLAQGHSREASILIGNRVPDGVEAADSIDDLGQVFGVATSISLGVLGIDFRDVVEWLMDVTCVMDHESQSE